MGGYFRVLRCSPYPNCCRGRERRGAPCRGQTESGKTGIARSDAVKPLNPIVISGREVLPLVEGGKGISISNGESSGAWAASGGIGTFSGVNADSYNEAGEPIPQRYFAHTRRQRPEALVASAIAGGIQQARVAH